MTSDDEIERERSEKLAELDADGPEWRERFAVGSFGCHELLDRTHLVSNLLWEFVIEHPSCLANPSWYAQAREAFALLDDLYQKVRAEHV